MYVEIVSLVYMATEQFVVPFGRSLMKRKNKWGPMHEPLNTPMLTQSSFQYVSTGSWDILVGTLQCSNAM